MAFPYALEVARQGVVAAARRKRLALDDAVHDVL
jgi:hypothetical protein